MTPAASRIARFSSLVAAQPDNELFRFSLAQALLDDGRTAEAGVELRVCVERKADWMLPRILLGKLLLAEGKPDEARPLLERALTLAIEQDHEDPAAEVRGILAGL
jgi:predicted Zn-dependent protease